MARCTGCGNELPAAARFCPLCGAQAGAQAPNPNQTIPPQQRTQMPTQMPTSMPSSYAAASDTGSSGGGNSKIAIAAGGGLVLILIAAFLLAKASGLLGAKKTEVPSTAVLNAPPAAAAPAPVFNVKPVEVPKTQAPVLQPPTTQGNPMPEDVIAYLRWLKQFEAARRDLKARGDAQMMVLMTNMAFINPATDLMKEPEDQKKNITIVSQKDYQSISRLAQEWNSATNLFQQRNPPNPCAPLATSYNTMMGTVVSQVTQMQQMIGQIAQATSKEGGATPDLQRMLATLTGENNNKGMSHAADSAFQNANDALNTLRNRYTSMPQDIDQSHFDIADQSKVTVPAAPIAPGM